MSIITDEQASLLRPGMKVTVRKDDGYLIRGRLIGLEAQVDGMCVRVLPADGIERKVPLPASVHAC